MKDFTYHIFEDGNGYAEIDLSGSLGILKFTHEVDISFRLDNTGTVKIQRVTELGCGGIFAWDLSCLDEREQSLLKAFRESVEKDRKESCA